MGRAQNATAKRRFDVVMGKRRGLLAPALFRDDPYTKQAIKDALKALSQGSPTLAINLLNGLEKEPAMAVTPAGKKLILALARHSVEEVALGSIDSDDNELTLAQESFRSLLGKGADEEPLLDTASAIEAMADRLYIQLVKHPGLINIGQKQYIKVWYEYALAEAISENIRGRGVSTLRKILAPDNQEWRRAILRVAAEPLTPQEMDQKRLEAVSPEVIVQVLQVAKIMTKVIPAPRLFTSIEGRKYMRRVFVSAGMTEITGRSYCPPMSASLVSREEFSIAAKTLNLNEMLLVRSGRQPKS